MEGRKGIRRDEEGNHKIKKKLRNEETPKYVIESYVWWRGDDKYNSQYHTDTSALGRDICIADERKGENKENCFQFQVDLINDGIETGMKTKRR